MNQLDLTSRPTIFRLARYLKFRNQPFGRLERLDDYRCAKSLIDPAPHAVDIAEGNGVHFGRGVLIATLRF